MVKKQDQWKSRTGFLLATIGSAIGVSNIWRFSYLAYKNGGGAFLLPYITALCIIGIPLLIIEQTIGHKMRGSAPLAFRKIKKKFELMGWWPVVILVFGLNLYYAVILSDCLNYFGMSFTLAWGDNPNNFFFNDFLQSTGNPWVIGAPVLAIVVGLLIIWILNWVIVSRGLRDGIEKVCKILIPLLILLVSILVIRGVTLPGAMDGIRQYLIPDFKAVLNPGVWIDAFSQVFFSLSIGMGVIIAYSKYLPKKSNLLTNAIIVGVTDTLFSVFTGLAVFGILGNMMLTTGLPLTEVVEGGIGLAFVVFPKAFNSLPFVPQFVAGLFFLTLIAAGLSSMISMIVAFLSGLIDKFGVKEKRWITIICISGFTGGIIFTTGGGIIWLDIVDHFLLGYGLVLVGLIESILIAWVYGIDKIIDHVNNISSLKIGKNFGRIIKYATPGILGITLMFSIYGEFTNPYGNYPISAILLIGVGWTIATAFIALIITKMKWKKQPTAENN